MSWTEERVELLSKLWLEGRSASQISTQLGAGLTRNAVIGKVHRLGLAGRVKSGNPEALGVRSVRSEMSELAAQTPRRAAPRPSVSAASAPSVVTTARAVQGNNALAVVAEIASEEAKPLRVLEEVVVPLSLRVTIVDLRESMCKWPLGDPSSSEFRYCGSPAHAATPYCQYHGKLAYQPAQERRRDRERERRPLLAR